jgi:hypothetical protein
MVNLISPGTGHVIDPVTHREQMRRIGEYAAQGLDHAPRHLRFVTWTLKYNRCHWLELLTLKNHYERAEMVAKVADDGAVEVSEAKNITQFALTADARDLSAGLHWRQESACRERPRRGHALVFKLRGQMEVRRVARVRRAHGQAPWPVRSDRCSRGRSSACAAPAGPGILRSAPGPTLACGDRLRVGRYMRGDLPVKDDTEITEADVRTKNLVLFGDPGCNLWIRKALSKLPLVWSRDEVRLGGERRSAKDHAPALICASPLAGAGDHYLVLNSGHTFHEQEFAAFNYLLFPRLGDWAMMKVVPGAETWQASSLRFPEEVVHAGFFDETWKKPAADSP